MTTQKNQQNVASESQSSLLAGKKRSEVTTMTNNAQTKYSEMKTLNDIQPEKEIHFRKSES